MSQLARRWDNARRTFDKRQVRRDNVNHEPNVDEYRQEEELIAQSLNLHADASGKTKTNTPDLIGEMRSIVRYSRTADADLVLCFDDGSEFQISIIRSN